MLEAQLGPEQKEPRKLQTVIVASDRHEVCSSNVHSVQNQRSSIRRSGGRIYGQQEYCQQK